ncbi:hypothetical protein DRQ53_09385 [bacterium]|nr:MAG: hypothetical protein DRQ32_02190 [bacterium]RKZ15312.1 MAG: hypothetical protein DRQ53_09385 [bacterium]
MIGKKLNQYEVTARIGQGGMGEVFRARDTQLGREVAIKILPREMSGDPERAARFQREARMLAALQHTNIASVYGFEEVDGVRFLAMELVDGIDLAQKLEGGRLPEEDAREIIRKIAAGLDEAHCNGIMHRDLKPANVMITPEGQVKILDFGLARACSPDSETGANPALSPTITAAMTQAGTILGTAAYMAPEQARGRRVDHRADIWAMGVIFFELLVGRRLFEGETMTDVLASVIKVDPDLDRLPAGIHESSRRMLRKCLQRDPAMRLRSAADAALELDEADLPGAAVASPTRRTAVLPWLLAALLAIVAGAQFFRGESTAPPSELREYQVDVPRTSVPLSSYRAGVSPDGRTLVTVVVDSLGQTLLHLRSLVDGSGRFMPPEVSGLWPFWSPDSRFIGHFSPGRLRKLHVESGSAENIAEGVISGARGGDWSSKGQILYAPDANSGLMLVDANGGEPRVISVPDTTLVDGSHRWPEFLPDGEKFVFNLWSNILEERQQSGGIYLSDIHGAVPRRLLRDVSAAIVVSTGQLLFHRNGRLMAVDIDLQTGELEGDPRLVATEIGFMPENGALGVSASSNGDLFLGTQLDSPDLQLHWLLRDGTRGEAVGPAQPIALGMVLSPDGGRYAVELLDDVGSVEIWIGDLSRRSQSRLSPFESDCWGVQFSSDSREVVYAVQDMRGGRLYRHQVSGASEPDLIYEFPPRERLQTITQWPTPDLMLADIGFADRDVTGICSIDPGTGERTPVLIADYDQDSAVLSPDGRWLAYASWETGRSEVYVRPWPALERKWQVSSDGGLRPVWSKDGKRLIFLDRAARNVYGAEFSAGTAEVVIGLPELVTAFPDGVIRSAVAQDHSKYLIGISSVPGEPEPIRVLVGWGAAARGTP